MSSNKKLITLGDNGWSDPTVGTWSKSTSTGTLMKDLNLVTIQIIGDGITLDGNKKVITGDYKDTAIIVKDMKLITIKNLKVQKYSILIDIENCNNTTVIGNELSNETEEEFENVGTAISIVKSNVNLIDGNLLFDIYNGIIMENCYFNNIKNNKVNSTILYSPVEYILTDCYRTLIANNDFENMRIELNNGVYCNIAKNKVYSSLLYCVSFNNSKNVNIYDNEFKGAIGDGGNAINVISSKNFYIYNNICHQTEVACIRLKESNCIKVTNNNISQSENYAISIEKSEDCEISQNTLEECLEMIPCSDSSYINISNNHMELAELVGLDLIRCSYMKVSNNKMINMGESIRLESSKNIGIYDNTIKDNHDGSIIVNLISASKNTFINNTIEAENSPNSLNLSIDKSSNCNNIYNNNFISSGLDNKAYDAGYNNIFSLESPIGGNYWRGFDKSSKINPNFVEYPYVFIGNKDFYPWGKESGWYTTI